MVLTYLQQRQNSPASPRKRFPDFPLAIADVDDSDSEDEVDEGIDDDEAPNGWSTLPHVLLEDILAFVPQKDRHAAALVCRRWAQTFTAPRVWRKIEIRPNSFMCKKMRFRRTSHGNGQYQKTYVTHQKVDSPKLFQDCIRFIGRYVKCIEFCPMSDCRKVVEFLSALEAFKPDDDEDEGVESCPESAVDDADDDADDQPDDMGIANRSAGKPLKHLEEFLFSYAFDTIETCYEGTQVLGTGGTILAGLKTSVSAFKNLKRLQLQNLFLDADDGFEILNSFVDCKSLRDIDAFNLTKEATTTVDPKLFPELETLLLSPLQLTEELVSALPLAASLRRLDIAFNEFSDCSIQVVDKSIWTNVKEAKPSLEIRLEGRGDYRGDFPVIAHAPVTHIVHLNPTSEFTVDSLKPVIECYKSSLTGYAHVHLPCTHLTKASAKHVHAALMELARSCPRLTAIAVRDMIYSSTILHLLRTHPNIRSFYVRRNGLLMKNVFSPLHDRHLTDENHRFLRQHSNSVKNLRCGVDLLLDAPASSPAWRPLTDNAFKKCFT